MLLTSSPLSHPLLSFAHPLLSFSHPVLPFPLPFFIVVHNVPVVDDNQNQIHKRWRNIYQRIWINLQKLIDYKQSLQFSPLQLYVAKNRSQTVPFYLVNFFLVSNVNNLFTTTWHLSSLQLFLLSSSVLLMMVWEFVFNNVYLLKISLISLCSSTLWDYFDYHTYLNNLIVKLQEQDKKKLRLWSRFKFTK